MVTENVNLRELVSKGPKCRKSNKINYSATEICSLNPLNLTCLSEWKDRVKELAVDCILGLKGKFRSPKCKVLNQPDVKDTLHADFVLVPSDKAANNAIVVCKKYYTETLVKELSINSTEVCSLLVWCFII